MHPFSAPLFSGYRKNDRQGKSGALSGGTRQNAWRVGLRQPLILMILSILLLHGQPVLAAAFPGSESIPAPPSSQATFENWLQATGRPVASRIHAYKANYATFRDYKMLVYGSPSQVPGNRFDQKASQYASLGYSYDEIVVTNSLFRDDSPGGVTKSTPWQWKELDMGTSAKISWARLSVREKDFIKQSTLTYRDNSYGGMTFSSLGLSEKNTVVLTPPSWHLGFALYTTHYRPGSSSDLRYATFNGIGAGSVTLAGSITVLNIASADGSYTIASNEDHIDLSYEISGNISAFSGLAAESDIRIRGAGNETGWMDGSGTGPWVKTLTIQVSREELIGLSSKQIKLQGMTWVVSQMGDIQLLNMEKTVDVKAAAIEPPFTAKADIKGYISYFSGQTDSQGRTMPIMPHRFLIRERVKIIMDFSREPSRIEYVFLGETHAINGIAGKTHYEDSLIIPIRANTLEWNGKRITPPLVLTVTSWDRSQTPAKAQATISDIDLTGSVYDITYIQVR
jgi:hypothetical protein